ncbi:MAG: hypothetical protein DRI26_08230 [Chloroflexi bacterium]|nr:MAG: hypothetical protein DRI26_08230 [Chloroflexota bacterium]
MNDENQNTKILKSILKWIKFLGWPKAREALEENLKDEVDRLIYHFSDGEHGIRDIIPKVKAYNLSTSYGGIHGKWQRWAKDGIVMPKPVRAGIRYVKIFDLAEFGIELPEKPEEKTEEKTASA